MENTTYQTYTERNFDCTLGMIETILLAIVTLALSFFGGGVMIRRRWSRRGNGPV